jgi:hypothetical protein
MKRVVLPTPPDPAFYPNNPLAWQRAVHEWMNQTKFALEQASQINDTPLDQAFQVSGSYAITTAISGTSTGTQITEFLCSLVAAMNRKGITSSKPQTVAQ